LTNWSIWNSVLWGTQSNNNHCPNSRKNCSILYLLY
jgi:hypothetical protein